MMEEYCFIFNQPGYVRVQVLFDGERRLCVASKSTTLEQAQRIAQQFQSGSLTNMSFDAYPAQLLGVKFDEKSFILFIFARLIS
jgi:predicted regulator of Ras-like GTPase activity (Roadblock/LC7/MglB family)